MKYAAVIHRRFEAEGAPWVYVGTSASVLRLDETSCAVLDAFTTPGGRDPEPWLAGLEARFDVKECSETLRDMVALGLIRPVGEPAPPSADLPPMPYPLSTLVLNVTNKCNLSCTYCYEYGEDKIADASATKAPLMSAETARRSVDFLFESSTGRDQVGITFFGGETLLNFGTVKAAALHAEVRSGELGIPVNFALTTNATLLTDEVADFLVAHRFGINVSIDGPKGEHDRHRTFKSGEGSYDRIVPQIKNLIARNRASGLGRPIGARVTLTKGAVASLVEIFEHLTGEVGFADVGFAPVTSAPDRDYALRDADYEGILRGFAVLTSRFTDAAVRGEHHGFSNLADLLREVHQGANKAHPCGAGLGLVGVSTEGEIALCHRFVESGTHSIGHIDTGLDAEKRESFLQRGHISKKIACHECWAKPNCSGGCYHEAYVRYGDASQPNLHYCDWIRAWTHMGLEAYAAIMSRNPSFFERFENEIVMES